MIKRDSFRIILVLFFASIIRLWDLGNIPSGISVFEAKFGLLLSGFFGNPVLSPFWVRLPFAVIGIITLFLTYLLVFRLSKDKNISLTALLIMAFSPWHIIESRIAGYGMLFLFVFFIIFALVEHPKYNFKKISLILFAVFVLVFTFGLIKKNQVLENNLALQRNVLPTIDIIYRRVFINRIVENFRNQEKLIFESLDFGNYFFKGHPRERWGMEETQKLFTFLIPFLIIGFLKITKIATYFVLSWFLAAFSLILVVSNKYPGVDLILIIPLLIFSSFGVNYFLKKNNGFKKMVLVALFIACVFELCYFWAEYLSGKSESTFSPRKPVYKELASQISKNKKSGENVLVTGRLPDSVHFLKFYLGNNFSDDFHFEAFNAKNPENKNKLLIDILPYEPSPSEPLFTQGDTTLEFIDLIKVFDDTRARQHIYLFRLK